MTDPGIKSALLLDLADRFGGGNTLVVSGEAALANSVDSNVTYLPTDVRDRDLARVPTVVVPEAAAFGTVVLPAPPDRDLLRRHLLIAPHALQAGG